MLSALVVALMTASAPGASTIAGACVVQPAAGLEGTIVTVSGRKFEGEIVGVTGTSVTIDLGYDQVSRIPVEKIRGLIPAACLERRVPSGTLPPGAGPQVRLVLADGTTQVGRILERNADRVLLEAGVERREVALAEVLAEVALEERPPPIDLVERHLESPTGRLLPSGSLHLSLNEGTHLFAAYGITRWLQVSAGTVIPLLYADGLGFNWQAALQAGFSLGDHLHLAGGLHVLGSTGGGTIGQLSVAATWSLPRWDLTLFAGPLFPGLAMLDRLDADLGAALSVTFHVTASSSLLSENWVDADLKQSFHLLAYRLRWDRLAGDAGIGFSPRGVYPWIGFAVEIAP
jgi:hypothetical protein